MNKLKKLATTGILDTWYIIGSVIIGPLISITSVGFTTGGGDYCDASYYLNDSSLAFARRDQEFGRAELYSRSLSSLFFFIGICILVSLVIRFRKGTIDRKELLTKIILVSVMLFGYALVFLISGPGNQRC
jgi:hypothetical protein